MLKFYKLYDWMIAELGANTDAAIIAIIYSFSDMGKECKLSYSQIADYLKVARRNAIKRIKKLADDGYITITAESRETNIYTVNVENFIRTSDENVTTDNIPSDENVTSLVTKSSPPSDENVTSLVTKSSPPTITENKKESIKEREREPETENFTDAAEQQPDADTHTHTFCRIDKFPNIRVTKPELDILKYGIDYSKTKKTLDSYFAIIESQLAKGKRYSSHFLKIREMIMQDGGNLIDESTMQRNKQIAELKPDNMQDKILNMTDDEFSRYLDILQYGDEPF